MKITLIKEHEKCPYNCKNDRNIIERLEIGQKREYKTHTSSNKIIIITEGEAEVCFDRVKPRKVQQKEMFYVGLGQNLRLSSKTNAVLFIFRLQIKTKLCNCFPLTKLMRYVERHHNERDIKEVIKNKDQLYVLPVLPEISSNLTLLTTCLSSKLHCNYYFDLKINELLFAIGKLYNHQQQAQFFEEVLSPDMSFSERVRKDVLKYKTVSELAESMNYTISGFEKRFKKIFNTTPHQWIKQKKADKIYYDLTMTDTCLKEIVDKYEFKSDSYFNDFCKSNFGASPGKIRKNRGI